MVVWPVLLVFNLSLQSRLDSCDWRAYQSGGSTVVGPTSHRGCVAPPHVHATCVLLVTPQDEDLDPEDLVAGGVQHPGSNLGSRGMPFDNHSSEAAALRGLGAGPTPLQRLAAAALLRVVLKPVMGPATIEVLLHGMLLPALHMQVSAGGAAAADMMRAKGGGVKGGQHSSEAAALTGLGPGPTPLQHLAADVLLRVVLRPELGPATINLMLLLLLSCTSARAVGWPPPEPRS